MQLFATPFKSEKEVQTSCTKTTDIFIFTYETEPTNTNTHGSNAIRAANGKDARNFLEAIIPI